MEPIIQVKGIGKKYYINHLHGNYLTLRDIFGNFLKNPIKFFKLKTKKSFVEYLNAIRVSNACKLLIETEMGISEIAFECGFKTASNFNQLFKKLTGTTPKEYRKNVENGFH